MVRKYVVRAIIGGGETGTRNWVGGMGDVGPRVIGWEVWVTGARRVNRLGIVSSWPTDISR